MVILASFGKQRYQTGSFLIGQNWWKRAKLDNANETFWMIIGQTVLPDRRSLLIGQKLVENPIH